MADKGQRGSDPCKSLELGRQKPRPSALVTKKTHMVVMMMIIIIMIIIIIKFLYHK